MIRQVCSCTDEGEARACVGEHGSVCHWPADTDPFAPVCSFCREEEEKVFPETEEEMEVFGMMANTDWSEG